MNKTKLKKLWANFVLNANKAAEKSNKHQNAQDFNFVIKTDYSRPTLSKIDMISIVAAALFACFAIFKAVVNYVQL